jgi:Holliday junction resolvasome RuvABC DNA-binding subunit
VGALQVLGYSALDAHKAVSAAYREGMPLEDVIRGALSGMGR